MSEPFKHIKILSFDVLDPNTRLFCNTSNTYLSGLCSSVWNVPQGKPTDLLQAAGLQLGHHHPPPPSLFLSMVGYKERLFSKRCSKVSNQFTVPFLACC